MLKNFHLCAYARSAPGMGDNNSYSANDMDKCYLVYVSDFADEIMKYRISLDGIN